MAGVLIPTLISARRAMLAHTPPGQRPLGWAAGAVAVLLTWLAVAFAAPAARFDVVVLLLALWGVGALLGPATMSGSGVLKAEQFALLPIPAGRLAIGLLVATFPGVAPLTLLAALLVPLLLTGGDPVAVAVVVAGALFTWVALITGSRLVFAVLGALMRTRFGLEVSAVQFGLAVAAVLSGWMLIITAIREIPVLLSDGLPDGAVASVLAVLPTSWPSHAAAAARGGDLLVALGLPAAALLLAAVLVAVAAWMLRPDVAGSRKRRAGRPLGSRVGTGPAVLPFSPLGAVVGRELRQWWRDPWRGLELRTALYAGLATGAFTLLADGFSELAPLAGLVVAFTACLAACNMFGQDGTAVWLTVVGETEGTARTDMRGRLIAVLLLFFPTALVVSVVLGLVAGVSWVWPVMLAGLPALAGAATGIAMLTSVVAVSPGVDPRRRVGPNDAGGEVTAQAVVAFFGTQVLVLPTAGALLLLSTIGPSWLVWLAVPVGILNGVVAAWVLTAVAGRYLSGRLPDVYTRIRYGRSDVEGAGTLGRWEAAYQQSDDKTDEKADEMAVESGETTGERPRRAQTTPV